ncbi:MAG: electron transfer flavoprotein subunit alpha/FixB family protein, partial [Terracidiphilus sp.]
MSGVLVVIEQRDDRIARISWEALAAGQRLATQIGESITAVLLGSATEALAADVATHSDAKVIRVEHPLLAQYTPDAFILALHQLIENESPAQVVFPHTYQVRDYAPALAARLGQVLVSDVVDIGSGDDGPTFTRQLMQGRLNGAYRHAGAGPCFVSVQAGAFRAEAAPMAESSSPAPISVFTPTIEATQIRTTPGQPFRGSSQTVDLGSAQLIVSVGRGIKEADNLPIVQELATALGA